MLEKKNNRLLWIDLLRVIGIVGVIFMHIVGNTINTYGGLSKETNIFYTCVAYLFEFTMPMFIMISGMMFLNKKNITFKEMINKYCSKIIITIFLVGFVMVAMEEIFINKEFTINTLGIIINRIIGGDIWAHMWYLYAILGLYLITPVLVIIANNIEEKEYRIFLIILFILTIGINTLNNLFNLNIAFNLLGISGYIFYYFYGHYVFKYDISKKYKIISYVLSLISIVYIVYFVLNNTSLNLMFSYTTFIPFIIANSVILIFKDKKFNLKFNKIINSIGMCGYGIYVYHQLFINIIYKLLKIKFIVDYPYIGLLVYSFIIFICSYIFTYLMRKMPLLRKYLA